jgi:hypothetical protein
MEPTGKASPQSVANALAVPFPPSRYGPPRKCNSPRTRELRGVPASLGTCHQGSVGDRFGRAPVDLVYGLWRAVSCGRGMRRVGLEEVGRMPTLANLGGSALYADGDRQQVVRRCAQIVS